MDLDRFHAAFDRLLVAWRRHQDASRDVADLPELSRARIELEAARAAVVAARPPLPPPVVHPRPDDDSASWRDRAVRLANAPS
ncbi:MAG: hypothetical protein AAGA90_16220 [Actinomycetota bacterium]